jgi:hypothetical protein
VAGLAALVLLALRRYVPARATSALAVTAIIVGWAVAQYPYLYALFQRPPSTESPARSAFSPSRGAPAS